MILFNLSVLARPAESLVLRQPDPDGRKLWRALFDQSIGRICLVVNEPYERASIEHWCKLEGFKPSFYEILDEPNINIRAEKIHKIASIFGRPEWYIDNDPKVCAETLSLGIPTILVACPYVVRPEWGGDRMIKEWDSVVDAMEEQALKAAEKTWGDV